MDHTDFALAFTDGATIADDAGTIATMRTHALGDLVAPTGRLIACDPLAAIEMTPFAQQIAPGRYPVVLSVAALANEDERVACAMLRLSDAPVVRWEMARLEGQESVTLLEDEFFGFPVEAGVACLMDERAAAALDARFDADEQFAEQLIDQMESNATSSWDSANLPLDAESGANVVLYASGWGDGIYASYWGYAADGALACLVTDFGVI
jgi:hypothetical protein